MAKGADIIEFYENGFPSGHYHDDSEIEIQDDDGKNILDPAKNYPISKFGVIVEDLTNEHASFASFFNKWQKQRTVRSFTVEVPIAQADEFKTKMVEMGFKVS